MKEKKVGALGGKVWTSILLFGLIGQIAWVVKICIFHVLCKTKLQEHRMQQL